MNAGNFARFDPARVPSPCYVIDRARVVSNCRVLRRIADEAGVKVLLALKAFSAFAVADVIGEYLDGTAASGLYEAILGGSRFSGEVHTFAPGLKEEDLAEMLQLSDHLVLNSLSQYRRFAPMLAASENTALGLRLNPLHREIDNPLYDPAGPWSRLGVDGTRLSPDDLAPFSGIHVHALCDHGFAPFARFLEAVESRFAHLFPAIDWINLGGGVLFTDDGFPVDDAIALLKDFRARTGLKIYLEPGTAVALHAGAVIAEVVDVGVTGAPVVITDASATCHMPDVLEAPFTPECIGAESLPRDLEPGDVDDPNIARVGGPTCLAGDTIGTYRFGHMPAVGDRLVFLDLAYYTMVKNTTFNGTPLPAIAVWDSDTDGLEIVREFSYADFENRLG